MYMCVCAISRAPIVWPFLELSLYMYVCVCVVYPATEPQHWSLTSGTCS